MPRERQIKILILTSGTAANVFLVNQLLERHQVVGMVIEAPSPALSAEDKYLRRRRLVERHGLVRTFNKLLFNWYRSRFLSGAEAMTVQELFFPDNRPVAYSRSVPSITVGNINDPACIELIKRLQPDLLAVCGTSVIKPAVFSLAPRGAVNIHTGITPDYRSADPIFWALYNQEPDKVGVTIHFIDQGIDTGPIIHQQSVPLYCGDSMASIYARCVSRGAALYLRTLDEIMTGSVRTIDRSAVKGKAFYSINLGIVQYLIFRLRFRLLKRRLPREQKAAAALEIHR